MRRAPRSRRWCCGNAARRKGLADLATGAFAETTLAGTGYWLGFAVVEDPVETRVSSSIGAYGWGGVATTAFRVGPVEELTAMFCTQLQQLVYSALGD